MPLNDDEKAKLLTQQAELMGITVRPDYVAGILGNFSNFEALNRKIVSGIEADLPLDPLPVYLP
jgi:hypothetical protein